MGLTRLQPGSCCGCGPPPPDCSVRICLQCCDGTPYTCGATVTLKNATSGATLASGTSDLSTGCIQFDITSASLLPLIGGQREATIVVDPTNDAAYATYGATLVVSCSPSSPTTITLQPASATALCCACVPINPSLTLTDSHGSRPFVLCNPGSPGSAGWLACYTITTGTVCVAGSITTGTIAILYFMQCGLDPGGSGRTGVTIKRSWFIVTGSGTFPPAYVQSSCSTPLGCPDSLSGPCSYLGGIGPEYSQTFFVPPPCGPFAFSGSLTPTTGNHMPDPAAGTVAIS